MAHHGLGFNHLTKKKKRKLMDTTVYVVGFLMILLTIPQVLNIWWHKNAAGVSPITWGAYLLGAMVWCVYGVMHKEKPLVFTYSIWMFLDLIIMIGAIIY
jgi:uncharacterized protein with PQ loop repeat